MISRYFKVILLLIFLCTTILVVVIQYNSNKNIDELVAGNQNLLEEFVMKNRLQRLQNDILTIDNKVRSAVIRNKHEDSTIILEQIKRVRQDVKDLGTFLGNDSSRKIWQQLYVITEQKISRSSDILNTLSDDGKQAAEDMINTQKGVRLTEAIDRTSRRLEQARQSYLTEIIQETDENSQQAKRLGFVLAIVAITIVLLAFWFISNRIKQQQELIKKLNESQQLERKALEIKEHFIANMSHEIRTPLNAILGFTNLLKKQPLDKKPGLFVDSIHQSSEKLLTIINDVLDLSKIEAGMMRIEKSEFSFQELIDSVKTMLHGKAQEKKLKVSYSIDNNIPNLLVGDPIRLTQILVNLISNAIKFTRQGEIKVIANALRLDQQSVLIELQVADNGIGIAEDQLPKIFDRFTQAEESTTRRYGGTGLGLSIVQQIVGLLDGKIEVTSELGKGTVFKVQIPFMISEEKLIPEQLTGQNSATAQLAKNMKILVVEDNTMNQILMEHLLGSWDCQFRMADNGQEAVDILRHESYDLVLMDIQMPEMDGYTASRFIRNDLKLNVPVVAMTAHAFEGEREKCISSGMDDYLSKPIKEQELVKIIERYTVRETVIESDNPTFDSKQIINTIDLSYLREISGGSVQFEREILAQFIQQAPKELIDLEKAFDLKQWARVRSNAHTLKTTTSFLGLQPLLLKQLGELEKAESNSVTELIAKSMEEVMQVCNSAITEARNLLADLETALQ